MITYEFEIPKFALPRFANTLSSIAARSKGLQQGYVQHNVCCFLPAIQGSLARS